MPKPPPCLFPWSLLWLASLATLAVQSVLSSTYSSSSASSPTNLRPAASGKRPGFMERTLVLLDVNTRNPTRVLNDNFLSLQLDPSIIKDGWLDFLRYRKLYCLQTTSICICPFLKCRRLFGWLRTEPRCLNCHGVSQPSLVKLGGLNLHITECFSPGLVKFKP